MGNNVYIPDEDDGGYRSETGFLWDDDDVALPVAEDSIADFLDEPSEEDLDPASWGLKGLCDSSDDEE